MNYQGFALITFSAILISSCAHLTKEGAKVSLIKSTTQKIPPSCEFIASIKEDGFDNNLGLARTEARFDLRNAAAKKGANIVQVTSESESIFPRGWFISGNAYYCIADRTNIELSKEDKCKAKGGVLSNSQCVIDL